MDMAKAIQAFSGRDTFGNWIEVVQREDGQWFERHQENRGRYGVGTSKWAKYKEPTFLTRERSVFADDYDMENEYIELPEGKYIEWGFNKLERLDGPFTYRLPN
jgi:hypothetical protein